MRRQKIFVAIFYGVIILSSLGLAALVVTAMGQDGSPGQVAAIAGVAMLPGAVAGLALTARR